MSGAPVFAVLLLLLTALAVWPAPSTVAAGRLRGLAASAGFAGRNGGTDAPPHLDGLGAVAGEPPRGVGPARWRPHLFAGLAGSAVLAAFPSVAGGLLAATVCAGSYLLLRSRATADRCSSPGRSWMTAIGFAGGLVRDPVPDSMLPFSIDLLGVCLRAGMPTSTALRSVAGALRGADQPRPATGQLAGRSGVPVVFARVAATSELGGEPASAWEEWLGHASYGRLARVMVVTGESGSAVADRLASVSNQLREAGAQRAMARAQRTGVALMAPLGLCFLPAFVCLGVLPVIIGIADQVFG